MRFVEISRNVAKKSRDSAKLDGGKIRLVAILAEGSRRSLGHDDVDPCLCNGLQRRRVRTNASRFRENPDSASIAAS